MELAGGWQRTRLAVGVADAGDHGREESSPCWMVLCCWSWVVRVVVVIVVVVDVLGD